MLKGLRRRLAVLFTVFTAAVLATALGISLYMAVSRINSDNEQWFSGAIEGVATYLNYLLEGGAAELAYSDPYLISMRVDDVPVTAAENSKSQAEQDQLFEVTRAEAENLGFTAGWVSENYNEQVVSFSVDEPAITVQENIEATEDTASASVATSYIATSPVIGTDGIFRTRINGVDYRATYFQWPVYDLESKTSKLYEVAILENLSEQKNSISMTIWVYVLLFLLGTVVLYVANWLLAKLVLRPTEEGMRRQNDFVAAASHELRSPLAVIRSSLSAGDASTDEAEAQKFRRAAVDETERMSRLIEDLLLLAGGGTQATGRFKNAPSTWTPC